jgi:hypothetical protein
LTWRDIEERPGANVRAHAWLQLQRSDLYASSEEQKDPVQARHAPFA